MLTDLFHTSMSNDSHSKHAHNLLQLLFNLSSSGRNGRRNGDAQSLYWSRKRQEILSRKRQALKDLVYDMHSELFHQSLGRENKWAALCNMCRHARVEPDPVGFVWIDWKAVKLPPPNMWRWANKLKVWSQQCTIWGAIPVRGEEIFGLFGQRGNGAARKRTTLIHKDHLFRSRHSQATETTSLEATDCTFFADKRCVAEGRRLEGRSIFDQKGCQHCNHEYTIKARLRHFWGQIRWWRQWSLERKIGVFCHTPGHKPLLSTE